MKITSCLILILLSCSIIEGSVELTEIQGITFAKYGSREMKLDLYRPADQTELLPVIIFLHGGGWRSGEKRHGRRWAKYFAERNYVAVSIDYRLSGEAPFPAQIHDCKAVVRWIRANAQAYGIDPDRIGATGHSAGGHLAALLATSSGVEILEGEGGNEAYSSAIQAAVPMAGQSDLESDRIRSMTAQQGAEIWHAFLGGSLDENEATYQLASPRRHIDAEDPPMMFIAGELDNRDTWGIPIRSDMRRLKIPSGVLVIPGAGHDFPREPHWYDLAMSTAIAFFNQYLKASE